MTGFRTQSALPNAAPKPSSRDKSIDVIRGLCIVSMVSAHLAGYSALSAAFHVFPKFDGASGFVLLGGLVLGMVQSKRVRLSGLGAVQRKSAERLVVIYVAQLVLVALGVVAAIRGWDSTNFPDMGGLSGLDLLTHSLMMTLAPPAGDVLRLYVFMLALAMGAYLLLARGRWLTVLALSVALHLGGQMWPAFSSFSPYPDQAPSAGWAGWQLLFISALVLGWYWKELDATDWLDRHAARAFAVAIATALILAGVSLVVPESTDRLLFSKYTFPIGRIIIAYAVITAFYIGLRWLMRRIPQLPLRPLAMIGSYSLDSYIIQAVIAILVYGFASMDSASVLAQLVALGVLLLCWAWAEFRTAAKVRRHKTP